MGRFAVATVLGAIVYYVWQMLTWMVLPVHGPTVHRLPNESAVRQALVDQKLDDGVFVTPFPADPKEMGDPESEFNKLHNEGPIFTIYYSKNGEAPMPPYRMALGFVIDLIGCAISAGILSCAVGPKCKDYFSRVGVVAAFGLFLALMSHGAYFTWMRFELNYTLMFAFDVIVGWFLVGLIQAALIRPEPNTK